MFFETQCSLSLVIVIDVGADFILIIVKVTVQFLAESLDAERV